MEKPVKEWELDESFVANLKVINDAAVTVKLGSNYGEKIVKKDAQKQAMIQGVEQHRRVYENPTKDMMKKDLWSGFRE